MNEVILDMEAIEDAKMTMKAKFSAMIDYFLEDAESYIKTIRSGLAANNFPMAAMAAHTLKSSSFQLGTVRLGEIAREIEKAARNGQSPDEISVLAEEIEKTFLETRQAIKNL